MTELERTLVLIGGEIDYPPTPPVAEAVARRLQEADSGARRAARRRWRPLTLRAVLVAVLIALLLAAGVLAAVPSARNALLDLVGLRGATIERVGTRPTAPVRPGLDLGEPSSLASAGRSLAFRPLVPSHLRGPDQVFVRRPPPGGELSLVYGPRPDLPRTRFTGVGLLVGEFRGDLVPAFAGKLVSPGTRVEQLRVAGQHAVWIAGRPHEFFYRDPAGGVRRGTVRLAGNVLLVQRGRVLVRMEGAFGEQEAIAIARSLR